MNEEYEIIQIVCAIPAEKWVKGNPNMFYTKIKDETIYLE